MKTRKKRGCNYMEAKTQETDGKVRADFMFSDDIRKWGPKRTTKVKARF